MLNIKTQYLDLLSNEMCIDIEHLNEKVMSPNMIIHAPLINDAIETLCSYIGNKTEEDVNKYCLSIMDKNKNELYNTLDSIRMAFVTFISGGLKDLFVCQENEMWYPKIILRKVLEPNDISTLNQELIIYRGCDISEINLNQFGQSWSTSETVAKGFAFNHYSGQSWFKRDKRVIISAKCNKSDVLYSDQTESGEYEIAVNPHNLRNIQIKRF